jgi:hypothetical protein
MQNIQSASELGCAGRSAEISGLPGSFKLTKIPIAALVTAARSGGLARRSRTPYEPVLFGLL